MNKEEPSIDFLLSSETGKYTYDILSFYVPLALSIPKLRDNQIRSKATSKAISPSGVPDFVTEADTSVQDKIKRATFQIHPDRQLWGEEGEDNISEFDQSKTHLLTVDPIEGTNNFVAGNDDNWGSVISLVNIETKEPIIGIVSHPIKKQFYAGIKGIGAYVLEYNENGQLANVSQMTTSPEFNKFTFNNSPHFNSELRERVTRFQALGDVKNANDTFVDPESGALEAVRYRGTICFKTSNEMAAVFVILGELGGKVTDMQGKPWYLGINSLIAARSEEDYMYLKSLVDIVQ